MSETIEKTKRVPLREKRKLIRDFRKQTGLRLARLGELAGISEAMLSRFENGKIGLSEEYWANLCAAMEKFLLTRNAEIAAQTAKAGETAEKLGVTVPPPSLSLRALQAVITGQPVPHEVLEALKEPHEVLEALQRRIEAEEKERKALLRRANNTLPLDHPDVQELMASYQREIATYQHKVDVLEQQLQALQAALQATLQARDSD